ncbi:hypothetical protein GCM10027299_28350 [Larkinella ripae]
MKITSSAAFGTTLMALKILLLLIFQNKPLILFKLSCYALLVRVQVVIYSGLLYQSLHRR